MRASPERLRAFFVEACTADVQAFKPGNVRFGSPNRGVTADEFLRSAEACAPMLCAPDLTLGERVDAAVAARCAVVATNTNLGVILLCAPLAQAALMDADAPLRERVRDILAATTVADARAVYRAIRRAAPGGMGRAAKHDLADEPQVNLRTAMAEAADRDAIAAAYARDYEAFFGAILPRYLAFRRRWGYTTRSVTAIYLSILGDTPDSLVARKLGRRKAVALSRLFRAIARKYAGHENPDTLRDDLAAYDRLLKSRGINPGTSADVTVACIFAAKILENSPTTTGENYDN